jgi:hypothetical protein
MDVAHQKRIAGFCGLFFLLLVVSVQAQPVSSLLKSAENAARAGQFLVAGEFWERAGRLKNTDPGLLYKAAEAFAQARDYRSAADCYRVALDHKKFPLAGLLYARALKQQGRYAEASTAFETFAQTFNGEHKAVLMAVVENEIAGCLLAIQLIDLQDTTVFLLTTSDSLKTPENEFAPIPFSDQLLYFSRVSAPQTNLLRSMRKSADWGPTVAANALPEAASAQFHTGSFSKDGSRFYYTACEETCPAERGGSTQILPCEIYCLRRTEAGWGDPERLPDYINMEGSTAMFPNVTVIDGVECLFFSSNRAGGLGGLDLYRCERSLELNELDFSFPQNLGRAINTGADEVTPFFDSDTKTLWFSSLGHPSIGGLDVFKSEWDANAWSKPQNVGMPINSAADDSFFVLKRSGEGAFFTSNRQVLPAKIMTTDDDIFEVKWVGER